MPEPTEKTYAIRFKDGEVNRVKAHEVNTLAKYYRFIRDGEIIATYQLDSVCGWQIEEDNPR